MYVLVLTGLSEPTEFKLGDYEYGFESHRFPNGLSRLAYAQHCLAGEGGSHVNLPGLHGRYNGSSRRRDGRPKTANERRPFDRERGEPAMELRIEALNKVLEGGVRTLQPVTLTIPCGV
jgi:hypothetical protein